MRNDTDLVSAAIRKAHAAGAAGALDRVYAALGRTLATQFNIFPVTPRVQKSHDREYAPSDPNLEADPHAALLLAHLDHRIRCMTDGADPEPGDRALSALWHEPDALAGVLAPHVRDDPAVQKAVAVALFLKAAEHAPKGGISPAINKAMDSLLAKSSEVAALSDHLSKLGYTAAEIGDAISDFRDISAYLGGE